MWRRAPILPLGDKFQRDSAHSLRSFFQCLQLREPNRRRRRQNAAGTHFTSCRSDTGISKGNRRCSDQAMIDAMAIPPKDRFQVISEFKAGELIYDPDYLEVKRSDKIVFVQITLSTGRTPGQKRALFSRMAELLAKSHRAPAGGPACEFSRGELGEWGSSIPEGLVRKTTRATNEPPSLQIRVTGTNRLQVQSGQDQIWPMPPSTCSSTPVM
jgi:hypothetical protein